MAKCFQNTATARKSDPRRDSVGCAEMQTFRKIGRFVRFGENGE
jgi:hypothetical protein